MTERKQRFPDWAERERGGDLSWIRENFHVFWPLAQLGYQEVGRGAIVVDTTVTVAHPGGAGPPMGYLDQETIGQHGDEDTQRLVGEYEPTEERGVCQHSTQVAGSTKYVSGAGCSRSIEGRTWKQDSL